MTAPARFHQADARPLSVPQLAARWECSEGLIYKLIRSNRLQCFRLGALIRIAAAEVERFECQNTPSSASGEASPLSGTRMESADADNLPRRIGRAPRRKPDASGKPGTVHRGPWGD